MDGTSLTGLEGTNPLGFFAALGVQVLFVEEAEQPRLWWTDDVVPHAVVDTNFTVDRIVAQALRTFPGWKRSLALSPGFGGKAADDAKFKPEDIRQYLEYSLSGGPGSSLPAALLAEGSFDSNRGERAKPSDLSGLYFTGGPQCFLAMARRILAEVSAVALREGLKGPWRYRSKLPSLMWDIVDDRNHALSDVKPTPQNKETNPGPEALAILGFSRHPVFSGKRRTITRGCVGSWGQSSYTWPLWDRPAGYGAVDSLLAHTTAPSLDGSDQRDRWYRSWGVSRVLTCSISRFGQGYGTFRPPRTIWLASEPRKEPASG